MRIEHAPRLDYAAGSAPVPELERIRKGYGLPGSIRRVRELLPADALELRFGFPTEFNAPGQRSWLRCDELLAGDSGIAAWHGTVAAWLQSEYGHAPDRTAAGYIRTWYLAAIGMFAAQLFHHERRVPSLRPADLALCIAPEGRPHPVGVAVRVPEFVCLPDDPAAGTHAATVVASEAALANLLRARFAGHTARFAAAFRPPVRFGRRSVWGAATDALDIGLWRAGRLGGDEGAGVADAALVLPTAIEPFTSASTLRRTDSGDTWIRRRETCCFHYLVADGGKLCKTCPRQDRKS